MSAQKAALQLRVLMKLSREVQQAKVKGPITATDIDRAYRNEEDVPDLAWLVCELDAFQQRAVLPSLQARAGALMDDIRLLSGVSTAHSEQATS